MREEMDPCYWPPALTLVGCIVANFNPVGWKKQEEHTVDHTLSILMKMIFEITWDHFERMDKDRAIHDINEVIEEGIAEFTPSNKNGIIVEHSYNHVVAYFDIDGTYYIQHGHVTNVWTRLRHEKEPLIEYRGTEPIRA